MIGVPGPYGFVCFTGDDFAILRPPARSNGALGARHQYALGVGKRWRSHRDIYSATPSSYTRTCSTRTRSIRGFLVLPQGDTISVAPLGTYSPIGLRCPKSKLSQQAIIKVKLFSFFVYGLGVEVFVLFFVACCDTCFASVFFSACTAHAKGNCPCGTEHAIEE